MLKQVIYGLKLLVVGLAVFFALVALTDLLIKVVIAFASL